MHRRTASILVTVIVLSGFTLYYANAHVGFVSVDTFNPYGEAIGYLSIAESTGSPDEIIKHVTVAKERLVETGYVDWWSTKKTSFESIQLELEDIIVRARNISSLETGNELYNSEMSAIHAKLKTAQETLLAL